MSDLVIRRGTPADYDALGQLMFDAVHAEPSPYTPAQRRAWVAAPRSGPDWHTRLGDQAVFVAEAETEIAGFMSITPRGYIDFAYIRPGYRGTGLFRRLFETLDQHAAETGVRDLWVHASLAAAPGFTALGFRQVKREGVDMGTERLERFEMRRRG